MTIDLTPPTEVRQLYEHLLNMPQLQKDPELKRKLEKGMHDIQLHLDELLRELFDLHANNMSLLEALTEPERFKAINRLHGTLDDILTYELPEDMIDLGKLIASLRLDAMPVVFVLSKLIKHQIHHDDIRIKMLARLAYFELMCFAKRRTLIEHKIDLVCHGGAYSDVETLAHRELIHMLFNTEYRETLLEDAPKAIKTIGGVLFDVVTMGLRQYLCQLRQNINPEHLELAIFVVEVCQDWNPVDRLLWLNAMAAIVNERKWSSEHLKIKHALHMKELLPASMTKRLNRLLKKLRAKTPIEKQSTNTIYHFIRQGA